MPQWFYDRIIFSGQDYIPFIKKFDDQPVHQVTFTNIEDQDTLKPMLADGKDLATRKIFSQEHGKLGWVFGRLGHIFYQVCPSSRFNRSSGIVPFFRR